MKAKKIISMALAIVMVLSVFALTGCAKDDGTYTVGICQLAVHDALDAATKGFRDALTEEFGDKVKFIEQNAQGDVNTCSTIVNDFKNRRVDLIMANATPALQAAANATTTIPILGTSVTEYGVALGIDSFTGTTGFNVSGTSDLAPLDEQAAMLKELFPNAKKVGIIFCSAEPNSRYQVDVIKAELAKLGIEGAEYSFMNETDVASVAAAAAAASDVLYIPTDNTAATCSTIINGAIGDKPVIAGEEGICKNCGVATLSISYYDLGVTTGKMAAKILKGEAKIEEMAIEYTTAVKKYNADKCTELGITPPAEYVAIAK